MEDAISTVDDVEILMISMLLSMKVSSVDDVIGAIR